MTLSDFRTITDVSKKKALITGVTGQDGAYLAELLLAKGYEVHGIKRRSSLFNTARIDHLYKDLHEDDVQFILHHGDMTDGTNLIRLIHDIRPDEIYNLAAMSHVLVSFETPEYTANADAMGPLRLLEAVRLTGLTEKTRIYQASTSEMYGAAREIPQTEKTPFYPRSPYAVAKLYAYWITINYREAYGLFASNGILFNHESPLRGETFVTRKITRAVAEMALNLSGGRLHLGNLNAKRDWGHAKDYAEAMHLILQQDEPDDFVIATGRAVAVRDFVRLAFAEVGIDIAFEGSGVEEKGVITAIDQALFEKRVGFDPQHLNIGQVVVEIDDRYFRPTEADILVGDASKAHKKLGWQPKHSLEDLVKDMVNGDIAVFKRKKFLLDHDFTDG